jgi:hypothetical protein
MDYDPKHNISIFAEKLANVINNTVQEKKISSDFAHAATTLIYKKRGIE